MDINTLAQALTISKNNTDLKANEAYIAEAKQLPNYGVFLLNISCNSTFNPETQLNAAIQLKNYVKDYWRFDNDQAINKSLCFGAIEKIIVIPPEDKEMIRSNILDGLLHSVNLEKVFKQLTTCVYKIAKLEFMRSWKVPLIAKIVEYFNSMEEDKILVGVRVFFQLAKIHEFEAGEYKTDYNKSFEVLNSHFLGFLNNLLPNLLNEKAAYIYYKIIKIFFKSVQLSASRLILDQKNFESWNAHIFSAVRLELPGEMLKKTENYQETDAMNKQIQWKLKKLCFQFIFRIYHRYGNTENLENENLIKFCNLVIATYLKPYYELSLVTLEKSKASHVPESITSLIFKLLSHMVSRNHMIPEIESHLEIILRDFVVQNAMLTVKDFESRRDDPKSYILKQFDITENYTNMRYSVCQFVKTVSAYRKKNAKGKVIRKPVYFELVYKYLISLLEVYHTQLSSGNNPDIRIKEGVLYIIQQISSGIISHAKDSVEQLIELFVLNEFESQYGVIRERACSFVESFEEYKYTNMNLIQEMTKKICIILDSETELPVKVMAAISAPILMKNEGIKELLVDHVPKLLDIYLNLVNSIDLEEILDGLESIISRFGPKVKEYAVALTIELVKMFNRLREEEENDDDDTGEKLLVQDGVLRTLLKIIEIFVNYEDIIGQLEEIIEPIILMGLRSENISKIDDILDIISTLVNKGNIISQKTWSYFPNIITTVTGTEEELVEFRQNHTDVDYEGLGFENISDIIPILCNFIAKDPSSFLSGVDAHKIPLINRSIFLIQKIIQISKQNHDNNNIRHALRFSVVIIDTLKGKIDNIVQDILSFLVEEMKQCTSKSASTFSLIETIAACFYYDPILSIQSIDSKGYIEHLFRTWISLIPRMKKSEQRRTLLAFVAILLIEPQNQNSTILSNLSHIMKQIIEIVKELDVGAKTISKLVEDAVEEDEEEDGEEKRDKILSDYLKKAFKSMNLDDSKKETDLLEEELDDDDEEWDEFSDLKKITVADKINEILYLKEILNHISQNNPGYYEELMKFINDESRAILETAIKNAEDAEKENHS